MNQTLKYKYASENHAAAFGQINMAMTSGLDYFEKHVLVDNMPSGNEAKKLFVELS